MKWILKKVKLSELKEYENNPRDLTEKGMADLTKSIERFGLAEPLVVNTDNIICGGHGRKKVLENKGIKDVDCYYPERQLTDEEMEELNIRLNLNVAGKWNWDDLTNIFDEKDLIEWGFTEEELFMLDNITADEPDKENSIPEAPIEIVKPGDIWSLGKHKLICGDSTNIDDVKKLMGDKQAVLGFTSPPYWSGKEYETQKSVEEIDEFIKNVCISYVMAVRKDRSRIVINTSTGFTTSFDKKSKRQVLLLIDKWTNVFYELGWNLRHIRHWLKEGQLLSISPKTDMIDQHCEFFGTYENDEGEELQFDDILNDGDINILETFYNRDGKQRGHNRTGKKWAVRGYWADIRGNAKAEKHCASFPVEIPLRHILLYTKRDEIVLDLFGGAGTTIIAAEKSNRIAYVCELSPHYCDICLQRYFEYCGVDPVRDDGKKWGELMGEIGKEKLGET